MWIHVCHILNSSQSKVSLKATWFDKLHVWNIFTWVNHFIQVWQLLKAARCQPVATFTRTQKQKKKRKKATFWSVMFEKWLPAWHRAAPTSHSPLISLALRFVYLRPFLFIYRLLWLPRRRIPAARLRSADGHRWWEKSVHAAQTTALSRSSRTGLEGLSSPHRSALSCFWSCVN